MSLFKTILMVFIYFPTGNAQSLIRECITSTGNYISENGTTVQQTIGQSYGTTSNYSDNIRYNPGFQQPVFTIETIKSSIDVTVFPNPTSNLITIETLTELKEITLQITNIAGQILFNEKTGVFKSRIIDCSDWANGTYLITLSDPENSLYSSKLIISK